MASCTPKDSYTIDGIVSGYDLEGKAVYLQALDTDFVSRVNIDTTFIKDGKYRFTGLANNAPTVNFILLEGKGWFPFILEPGNIKINVDKEGELPIIKGTPMNDRFFDLISGIGKDGGSNNPIVHDYLRDNMQNQVGAYFLALVADSLSFELKKELLASMAPEFKENGRIRKIEEQQQFREAEITTAVGNTFTDLKGKTPEGNDAALSDYAGKDKYVLIDFWASWCPPCREEMPKLVELYGKYKDKGLEIVGISLDKENEAWKNGIKKLNITWPQISDLKFWDSSLAAAYGVNGIPLLILIDKDGKIIERGLDAEEMGTKLAELIK